MLCFHRQEKKYMLPAKCNGSGPVVYQTKNIAREIKQQDQEKISFKRMNSKMSNANHWNICFRDHRQTTFVTLNRFCPLSNPQP